MYQGLETAIIVCVREKILFYAYNLVQPSELLKWLHGVQYTHSNHVSLSQKIY